jgi:hypothetical protein
MKELLVQSEVLGHLIDACGSTLGVLLMFPPFL